MKKILFICLIVLGMTIVSCTKEESTIPAEITETTDSVVDKFVGSYSVYCNDVAYGNSIIDVDSLLIITKVSSNKIITSGYFNTIGVVTDTAHIYFESISYKSSQEESSIEFTGGTLNGNVLTFNAMGHYMYGWNGPGGIMNGTTQYHYFTAYKN